MENENLTDVLKKIIEKELKNLSLMVPKSFTKDIVNKISPQIENIIEKNGYVKKSKYKNLERIIDDLEQRIKELEK
mgnify:FL=1|tara:strand:- start:610 stop:837 length:228 start_codon:yes stop_codon:yes gene_type:complete